MHILVMNGPNLNFLGKRDHQIYGKFTLERLCEKIEARAIELSVTVTFHQSNAEGTLIDFVQENAANCDGIIVNAGALTHYGYALRDALDDAGVPIIEVHISNIYAREEWRHRSVIASIAKGQITGLGWRGYLHALENLVLEESNLELGENKI